MKRIIFTLGSIIITFNACNKKPVDELIVGPNPQQHPLGALKENDDVLDRAAYYEVKNTLTNLPQQVDLSSLFPAVGNQGTQNSCVGWALAYYKTYQEKLEMKWDVRYNFYSPSWIYNQINKGIDSGAYLSDAYNLLIKKGCDLESNFPYFTGNFINQPNNNSYANAARYKAKSFAQLPRDLNTLKQLLAQGKPFITSVPVYPDFDNLRVGNEVYDNIDGNMRGLQAMCVVGYDDTKNAFKVINSWGTSWGVKGYGYIAYDLLINNIDFQPRMSMMVDDKNNITSEFISGDYDGDKRADLCLKYDDGRCIIDFSNNSFGSWDWFGKGYGAAEAHLVTGDFDGDGKFDISVKTDGGYWNIDYANDGFGVWNWSSPLYGTADNHPLSGDFDGDGKWDLSRKTDDGYWSIDYANNGFGKWDWTAPGYGTPDNHPLTGDFDGDGKWDLARKTDDGYWSIDYAHNGYGKWDWIAPAYGGTDNHPLTGDYDGDKKYDIARKTDNGYCSVDYASNGFGKWDWSADIYGDTDSYAVPGDYDGDGKCDISIRKDDGSWLIDYARNGFGVWDWQL